MLSIDINYINSQIEVVLINSIYILKVMIEFVDCSDYGNIFKAMQMKLYHYCNPVRSNLAYILV